MGQPTNKSLKEKETQGRTPIQADLNRVIHTRKRA